MLADWQQYLYLWQIPLIIAFIGAWMVGGAIVFHRSLRRRFPQKKVQPTRCWLAMFLAGLAGTFSAAVVAALFMLLADRLGAPLRFVGIFLALITMAGMAYLVIFSMFGLTAGQTLKAVLPTAGVIAVAGVVVGLAAFIPARSLHFTEVAQLHATAYGETLANKIAETYLEVRGLAHQPEMPDTLDEMKFLDVRYVRTDSGTPRWIYVRPDTRRVCDQNKGIMIAELQSHHGGRAVVLSRLPGGKGQPLYCQWMSDEAFNIELNKPENQKFKAALSAVKK